MLRRIQANLRSQPRSSIMQHETCSPRFKIRIRHLFCGLLMVAGAVAAQTDDPLQRCRSIQDPSTRLSCYDAIALPAIKQTAPSAAPATFGLPDRSPATEAQYVESTVLPNFTGWKGSTRISLENGQVWEVVDGSSGSVGPDNRRIVVRRGALGSYRIEFEGLNISPTVRRVK